MRKLLLIDANSIIHRSFHALPPLTAPDGAPAGAIYGIASILLRLWRDERPDYAAALFDRPEPTFRDKEYAEYKAQRPPAAEELIAQIIEAHNLFTAFGIRTFEKPGYEADDLIATLAEHFKHTDDLQIVILTGDRDTLQLVEGDTLVVRSFNKGVSDTTIYNEMAVIEKYGISPKKIVEYKALVGDASDNIKGVPGVGPKTAVELIRKFGTIKEMYRQLGSKNDATDGGGEEIEKLRTKFGHFEKEAKLSEMLVTLERNAPIEVPPLGELASDGGIDGPSGYFEKMGFSTLWKRLRAPTVDIMAKSQPRKEQKKDNQASLF